MKAWPVRAVDLAGLVMVEAPVGFTDYEEVEVELSLTPIRRRAETGWVRERLDGLHHRYVVRVEMRDFRALRAIARHLVDQLFALYFEEDGG